MDTDISDKLPTDCPICKKTFKKSQSLYGHLQCHSLKKGKYAFDCKSCNLQFHQLSEYWKHLRLVHEESKNRRFSCSKCPDNPSFERKSQLRVSHMKSQKIPLQAIRSRTFLAHDT